MPTTDVVNSLGEYFNLLNRKARKSNFTASANKRKATRKTADRSRLVNRKKGNHK